MSKVVCKVYLYYWHFGQIILCCGAVLRIGRCLAAPSLYPYKPRTRDNRHTQNIQINKATGKNEKCVFYFMEKNVTDFLANPKKDLSLICLNSKLCPRGSPEVPFQPFFYTSMHTYIRVSLETHFVLFT